MSVSNGALSESDKEGEEMNKTILYLSIGLVLLILSASAVTAIVSPTPPRGIKGDNQLMVIWNSLVDLQNQITALTTKVNNIDTNQPSVIVCSSITGENYKCSTVTCECSYKCPEGKGLTLQCTSPVGMCVAIPPDAHPSEGAIGWALPNTEYHWAYFYCG